MKGFEVEVWKWERWIIHLSLVVVLICAIGMFINQYILFAYVMILDGFIVIGITMEIRYREYLKKRKILEG